MELETLPKYSIESETDTNQLILTQKLEEPKLSPKEKEKIAKRTQKIEDRIDIDLPDYFLKYKLKEISKTKRLFCLFLILIGISGLSVAGSILLRANIIIILVVGFFAIFLTITLLIYGLVRLFIFGDWMRIRNRIIINSGDYIIAHFFSNQKRLRRRYIIPEQNDREFKLGKKEIYTINMGDVWTDERGIPNIFYISGIPNSLKFDFVGFLNKYFNRLETGESDLNIKENIDVRYSSEALQLFKDDEMMKKLHKDNSKEMAKYMLYFMIMIGIFAFVIVILVLVLGNKQPVVNVINSTAERVV